MKLDIVKASNKDVSHIARILTEALSYKLDHDDHSWGSGKFSEKEVKRQLLTGSTYLVFLNNEPVGTFSLSWEDKRMWDEQTESAGYLHRLAIRNGFHGKGIGQYIINKAIVEVHKNGRNLLRLDCDKTNSRLCAYYEKQGFKNVGYKPIPANNYIAVLYEKSWT